MPVPHMPAGAVVTLVDAIAVDAMTEGRRLVADQDGRGDGVYPAFSAAAWPTYIMAIKCVVVCIGRVNGLAEPVNAPLAKDK